MCTRLITIHNITLWTCPSDYDVGRTTPSPSFINMIPSPAPSLLDLVPSPVPSPVPSSVPSLNRESPSPAPSVVIVPSVPVPSPVGVLCPTLPIVIPPHVPVYNMTNITKTCRCNEDVLHALWIVPIVLLLFCVCLRKCTRYRITDTPAVRYLLGRSRSWPGMGRVSTTVELPERSQSEPVFDSIVV